MNGRLGRGRSWLAAVAVTLLTGLLLVGCAAGEGKSVGSSQSGTGADAVPSDHLALELKPDPQFAPGKKTPDDMPKQTVKAVVPLYPGAQEVKDGPKIGAMMMPNSPYLVDARAVYRVPASREQVKAWYDKQMASDGYEVYGSGTTNDSSYVMYNSKKQPGLQVEIGLKTEDRAHTLVQVLATATLTPPRQAESLLPTDTVKINVNYHPPHSSGLVDHSPPITIPSTITDPAQIAQLVTSLNSLPIDTAGIRHCTMDRGEGADLVFHGKDGQVRNVTFRPACQSVRVDDKYALYDQGNAVWSALLKMQGIPEQPAQPQQPSSSSSSSPSSPSQAPADSSQEMQPGAQVQMQPPTK